MAVSSRSPSRPRRSTIGSRQRLFTAPVDPTFGTPGAMLFDAVPSGERFVMQYPRPAFLNP